MPHLRNDPRRTCLVWGGYGWGNTGDDLTLAVALRDLRRTFDDQVRVLTPQIEHSRLALPDTPMFTAPPGRPANRIERWLCSMGDQASARGILPLSRRLYHLSQAARGQTPPADSWLAAFQSCSVLHLVGGGYLTDLFDLRPLLRPLWVARAMGMGVTTSPLGIGPFTDPRKARLVARALDGATLRVRDADSLKFCAAHQLPAEERPDDGFRLNEVLASLGPTGGPEKAPPVLGICVFRQYGREWSADTGQWWEDYLCAVTRELPNWKIEGFCFHTEEAMDYDTTRQIFARAGLDPHAVHPPDADYRRALMRLHRFRGVVSTRFHAVVTASVFGLTAVAVGMNDYYEAKMQCAFRHAATPVCVMVPHRDSPEAAARFLARQVGTAPGQ